MFNRNSLNSTMFGSRPGLLDTVNGYLGSYYDIHCNMYLSTLSDVLLDTSKSTTYDLLHNTHLSTLYDVQYDICTDILLNIIHSDIMEEITMRSGATLPNVRATLYDESGNAADLSHIQTVEFFMYNTDGMKVDGATATIEDAENGVVVYRWEPTDTDTPGTYEAYFKLTYNDGNVMYTPNEDTLIIEITDKN